MQTLAQQQFEQLLSQLCQLASFASGEMSFDGRYRVFATSPSVSEHVKRDKEWYTAVLSKSPGRVWKGLEIPDAITHHTSSMLSAPHHPVRHMVDEFADWFHRAFSPSNIASLSSSSSSSSSPSKSKSKAKAKSKPSPSSSTILDKAISSIGKCRKAILGALSETFPSVPFPSHVIHHALLSRIGEPLFILYSLLRSSEDASARNSVSIMESTNLLSPAEFGVPDKLALDVETVGLPTIGAALRLALRCPSDPVGQIRMLGDAVATFISHMEDAAAARSASARRKAGESLVRPFELVVLGKGGRGMDDLAAGFGVESFESPNVDGEGCYTSALQVGGKMTLLRTRVGKATSQIASEDPSLADAVRSADGIVLVYQTNSLDSFNAVSGLREEVRALSFTTTPPENPGDSPQVASRVPPILLFANTGPGDDEGEGEGEGEDEGVPYAMGIRKAEHLGALFAQDSASDQEAANAALTSLITSIMAARERVLDAELGSSSLANEFHISGDDLMPVVAYIVAHHYAHHDPSSHPPKDEDPDDGYQGGGAGVPEGGIGSMLALLSDNIVGNLAGGRHGYALALYASSVSYLANWTPPTTVE